MQTEKGSWKTYRTKWRAFFEQADRSSRIERLEVAVEREAAYRHLRVEGSTALSELFPQVVGRLERDQVRELWCSLLRSLRKLLIAPWSVR